MALPVASFMDTAAWAMPPKLSPAIFPVAGQQRQHFGSLASRADGRADLPRHLAKLAGGHARGVTGEHQAFGIGVLLFAALVVGNGQPTDGSSSQGNWRQNGKQASSRCTRTSAQLSNSAYTTAPVA